MVNTLINLFDSRKDYQEKGFTFINSFLARDFATALHSDILNLSADEWYHELHDLNKV